MKILDGKKYSLQIAEKLKKDLVKLKKRKIYPTLAVILVGHDSASEVYVRNKRIMAEKIGIHFKLFKFKAVGKLSKRQISFLRNKIFNKIDELNKNPKIHGIIVQLPLPKGIDVEEIINAVSIKKDSDAFIKGNRLMSPTIAGIIHLIRKSSIVKHNKTKKSLKCVIVANSFIFAQEVVVAVEKMGIKCDILVNNCVDNTKKPLFSIKELDKTYIKCSNYNINLTKYDICVIAKGCPHLLQPKMIKKDAVIIDVGTTIVKRKGKKAMVIGDVAPSVYAKISAYSPVPGGVGPLTVVFLMDNVIRIAKRS